MNEDIKDHSCNSSTQGLSSAESASCNDLLYWRPISSAPKHIDEDTQEDSLFLGFVPHSCGGYICVFYWNQRLEQWQNNIDGGTDKPSHWMPLPQPPVAI